MQAAEQLVHQKGVVPLQRGGEQRIVVFGEGG